MPRAPIWITLTVVLSHVNSILAISPADKIVYQPISAEAEKLGRIEKYGDIEKNEIELQLGDMFLKARLPKECRAYDAVPIEYTIHGDTGPDQRITFEAVAFENPEDRKGRDLYDLAVPGTLRLKVEYLGSRTGVLQPDRVRRLTKDSKHEQFPPYKLEPLVRSGKVKRGNYLFFKFRITNVGDTILDAEGFGGWMSTPRACTVDEAGKRTVIAQTNNRWERHLKYLYPGESFEQWVSLSSYQHGDPKFVRTLPPGKYLFEYEVRYRWNADYDWQVNMWSGKPWYTLKFPLEVTEQGGQAPLSIEEVFIEQPYEDRMPRYIRSLEEFMTSFKVFEKTELNQPRSGTMYIQPAPWTEQIVLKLIGNTRGRISTVAVPVHVTTDHLNIEYNPDNPFVVPTSKGAEPAFCTQNMPAMRATYNLHPEAEKLLRRRLKEKEELGVNVLATTGGDWHVGEVNNNKSFVGDAHAETFKYYFDTLIHDFDIPVFGWGVFPAKTHNVLKLGCYYWGETFDIPFLPPNYTYSHRLEMDVAHPDFPKLYAGCILFNYERWGDLWYRTANGDLLIDVEDSWGWLRDDINIRYMLGKHAIHRFHLWLQHKYGSVEKVNEAWGTEYKRINQINPQVNQGNEGKHHGYDFTAMGPVYNNPDNPFHDWTAAVRDWDRFRTELRCDIYDKIQQYVREELPEAHINIRTEGAMIPVSVPKDTDNPHLRHIYYVQRRQALISDILKKRGTFKYHSDYTTMPYTESEWRLLLSKLREQGMRGNYFPQFCTARDMVLNDHWGRDFTTNYNLAEPKQALMIHRLQAAYPVWRIMYEEGHCPGVMWEDYGCDGFVTETQKQELRLFRKHLDNME
jgi:hypothetical protein